MLEIYESWRRVADAYPGDRMFVAEAWTPAPERLARYVAPGRLHTAFNFDYLVAPWDPTALREAIDVTTGHLREVGASATWVLSNHDVVRHPSRYGRPAREPESVPTSAVPAVSDAAPDLALGTRRARAALLLEAALPGGMYVYQGEELGLPEVEDIPDEKRQDPTWERSGHTVRGRDGARVPLPWSDEEGASAGFSPDGAAEPWLPQPDGWARYAASRQQGDPDSVLELYRTVLARRRAHPALGDGDLTWVSAPRRRGAAPAPRAGLRLRGQPVRRAGRPARPRRGAADERAPGGRAARYRRRGVARRVLITRAHQSGGTGGTAGSGATIGMSDAVSATSARAAESVGARSASASSARSVPTSAPACSESSQRTSSRSQ